MFYVEFLDTAEIEAAEAVEWYENEASLGADLRDQIEVSIERVAQNPRAFTVFILLMSDEYNPPISVLNNLSN